MSKRRKIMLGMLLFLGVIVAAGVVLYAALINAITSLGDWLSFDGGCLGSEPYSNRMIEQMGGFEFPISARHIIAASEAFQDCFVFISFEMDVADFAAFLAGTYISSPLTPTTRLLGFDNLPLELDWEFEAGKNYLYGTGNNGDREYQTIAVDIEDPNQYIVYIITGLL